MLELQRDGASVFSLMYMGAIFSTQNPSQHRLKQFSVGTVTTGVRKSAIVNLVHSRAQNHTSKKQQKYVWFS